MPSRCIASRKDTWSHPPSSVVLVFFPSDPNICSAFQTVKSFISMLKIIIISHLGRVLTVKTIAQLPIGWKMLIAQEHVFIKKEICIYISYTDECISFYFTCNQYILILKNYFWDNLLLHLCVRRHHAACYKNEIFLQLTWDQQKYGGIVSFLWLRLSKCRGSNSLSLILPKDKFRHKKVEFDLKEKNLISILYYLL